MATRQPRGQSRTRITILTATLRNTSSRCDKSVYQPANAHTRCRSEPTTRLRTCRRALQLGCDLLIRPGHRVGPVPGAPVGIKLGVGRCGYFHAPQTTHGLTLFDDFKVAVPVDQLSAAGLRILMTAGREGNRSDLRILRQDGAIEPSASPPEACPAYGWHEFHRNH